MQNLSLSQILDQAVASGDELGCQCAFWSEETGEVVACSGWLDAARSRPVVDDSLFPVFSVGKAVATTAALRLIDRRVVSLTTRLCELWPAFTGQGREEVTLEHVLSHTSGLFCMPHADSPKELADWALMCERLARMRPAWQPGSRTKYQAFTYSWLLGEPLRRATGKPLDEIIEDEVLAPLSMRQECRFGIPENELRRVAELERAPDLLPPLPPRPSFWNPTENLVAQPAVRQACLPAFNGVASAQGLIKLGKSFVCNELNIISPNVLKDSTQLRRPVGQAIPEQIGYWELFGYGYLLYGDASDRGAVFGHGGYGGSELLIDQRRRMVFAFTKNRLSTSQATRELAKKTLGFYANP